MRKGKGGIEGAVFECVWGGEEGTNECIRMRGRPRDRRREELKEREKNKK